MDNTLFSNAGDAYAMRGDAAGTPAASLLSLAAAPTFVTMALWSAIAGGPAEMMCGSGDSTLSLNGMTAMYALMSVIHVSPWLTLTIQLAERRWRAIIDLTLNAQRKRTSNGRWYLRGPIGSVSLALQCRIEGAGICGRCHLDNTHPVCATCC